MVEGHEASHEGLESASGSRRKQSDVWEFFVKNGQKALCKVCNSGYAYHRGTSNLKDHLMSAHPSKLRPPEDQPCLNAYLSKTKCSDGCAKKITEHITDMVVHDLRPAAIVEGTGFKARINYIEPGYHVPSYTHIAEVARRKFTDGKEDICRQG